MPNPVNDVCKSILHGNKVLQKLSFTNPLSDEEVSQLCNVLQSNTHIETLDVSGLRVSLSAANEIFYTFIDSDNITMLIMPLWSIVYSEPTQKHLMRSQESFIGSLHNRNGEVGEPYIDYSKSIFIKSEYNQRFVSNTPASASLIYSAPTPPITPPVPSTITTTTHEKPPEPDNPSPTKRLKRD